MEKSPKGGRKNPGFKGAGKAPEKESYRARHFVRHLYYDGFEGCGALRKTV